MQASDFVHLHLHSEYSLLDGANRLDDLCAHVRRIGQPAVAVTDHGNLFGAIEFYKAAQKHEVQPILGFEAYVASGSRFDRKRVRGGDAWEPYYHLTLLARNPQGFRNLCKLSSIGYREGFYYKPRVDREMLEKHSEGLLVLSGCLAGELQRRLVRGDEDGARETVSWHAEVFGRENYYLEMQDHGIPEQHLANEGLLRLRDEFNLPLVITNDAHYLGQNHYRAHDALLCIQTGKVIDDERRFRFNSDSFYVKSAAEMEAHFGRYPEALLCTREIAERTKFKLDFGNLLLPRFEIPEDFADTDAYLAHLAREGLGKRFPQGVADAAWQRLDSELEVIRNMGFSGYFLITQDFVRAARRMGCSVGPGRGSAAGSLVAYALTITNIDPLAYDLLFERFLNPERVTMPDIDIDFADDRRELVIDYVKNKYGKDCVSQIITFSRMKAKAAIRDVGRVLGLSFGEVDRVAKLIPNELNITLGDAIERVPELREMVAGGGANQDLLEMSQALEGMCRHAGIHAAGVVITPEPVDNYVPLFQTPDGDLATQWDMKYIEEYGLLKMDFLGLRTLTILDNAVAMIRDQHGAEIDVDQLDMEDAATYELFGRADTIGVFQFESGGMREYLTKLKPERLTDLIAMNALYRPGPMKNIDAFIARKHGAEPIVNLHPSMEPILRDTYGIIVYQEQVMRIAQVLGGYSLGGADILRRAMGKKKADVMAEQKGVFIAGCRAKAIDLKTAEAVFELLEEFAQYGFNKSHSAAYAYVAYQTAYLKTHYPREFMAAAMTSVMNDSDQVSVFMDECRRMGIDVLPPDVFESGYGFSVSGERIRFGLGAVKNVGRNAIESMVKARAELAAEKGVFEWAKKLDLRLVNKRVIESLAAAGALDQFAGNRASKWQGAERIIDIAAAHQREVASGQTSLFADDGPGEAFGVSLEDVAEWEPRELLRREHELLGHYISGHPLEEYRTEMERFASHTIAEHLAGAAPELDSFVLAGLITSRRDLTTRRGDPMCVLGFEDFSGVIEAVFFPEAYQENREILSQSDTLVLVARRSPRESERSVIVEKAYPLSEAFRHLAERLHVRIAADARGPVAKRMRKAMVAHGGTCPITLNVETQKHGVVALPVRDLKVRPSASLDAVLAKIDGVRKVSWTRVRNENGASRGYGKKK